MATVHAFRAAMLCSLLIGSPAFNVRKRSIPWRENGKLDDALGFIRSERKRIGEQGPSYYWSDEEQVDPERLLLAEILARENEGNLEDNFYPEDGVEDFHSLETPADMEELENILPEDTSGAGDREDDKRTVPFQIVGPKTDPRSEKREYDPSSLKSEDKKTLSDEEVKGLLGEGEARVSVPVTDEEIEEALGKDASEDIVSDAGSPPSSDNVSSSGNDGSLNKESVAHYETNGLMKMKSKRSGRFPTTFETDEADQAELAREYIKTFLELEDDENTNLANALNLATLSQVEKSDRYVQSEANFIKQAIEDEEEIQSLKESLHRGDKSSVMSNPDVVDQEIEDGPPLLRKRMDPEQMMEQEKNMPIYPEKMKEKEEEEPIPNDVDTEDEEELLDEELREYLSAKLRQYILRTQTADTNSVPLVDEDEGIWEDGPVPEEAEGVSVEELYLNPFWRKILDKYRAGEIRKREDPPNLGRYINDEVPTDGYEGEDEEVFLPEEDEEEEEIGDALQEYVSQLQPWQKEIAAEVDQTLEDIETCPSLDLVDDCEIAHVLGLRLDQEALDLCNRHQLCYICGAAYGLEDVHCDVEYRDDASRLCMYEDNPTKCHRDAVTFLELLKEHHAFYNPYDTPNECLVSCTKEWIYGL